MGALLQFPRRWTVRLAYFDAGALRLADADVMAHNRIDAERLARLRLSTEYPHIRLSDVCRVVARMV